MIVLTADVHGPINYKRLSENSLLNTLTEKDFFIVCGDFGIVWDDLRYNNELLTWSKSQLFHILFIDGNHENFTLLNKYPVKIWNGGKIHQISKNLIHLMRGQVFIIAGRKFFTFGGAFSIKRFIGNSPIPMWEEEMPTQNEYREGINNLKINNFIVDYIITHTAPKKWLHEIDEDTNIYEEELNIYFDQVEERTKFKHWYFGHFHKDIHKERFTILYEKMVCLTGD